MGSRLETNSANVKRRIENHNFEDEKGEEYEASRFGGFTDYFRRKKIKLQNLDAELRAQSPDKPSIFRGVVVHINGYTQPSLNDLHKLIVTHGGGFLQYLDGKTTATHVVASNLTPKKKVEFAKYRIVKPAWIVDSVTAGKLLPWDSYRVVDEGVSQKVLGFDNGQVVSQTNTQRNGYREQTDTSWYTPQIRDEAPEAYAKRDGYSSNREPGPAADEVLEDEDLVLVADQHPASRGYYADVETAIDQGGVRPHPIPHRDSKVRPAGLTPGIEYQPVAEPLARPSTTRRFEEQETEELIEPDGFANSEAEVDEAVFDHLSRSPNLTRKPSPRADAQSPLFERPNLTAEEHNAVLLSDPHLAKSSTANPDFLNQYYRESRLHHLSTWKAELKAQLQTRAQEKTSSQKIPTRRVAGARRYVMHVDFDSFFAAVSLLKHPNLVNAPVVIAHGSGPGSEIASCNYPARNFGIKNGMWMKSALQLCPDLKVLPYDFKAYEEASRGFYDSILATNGIVQSVSIDEALVDISAQCIDAGGSDGKGIQEGSIYREQAQASEIAERLRESIKVKTGCAVSIGIGNNILLAKVALRKAKPAGQHLIKPEEVLSFIGELLVTDLPGVAYSIGGKLEEIGVKYVKDIRILTRERLVNTLGPKTGEKIWDYSRGIDRVEVGDQAIRKSVSAEVNWGIRFITQEQADEFVQCLCEELHKRLLEQGVKGKLLTMKIMRKAADAPLDPPKSLGHGKCDTFNKSVVLGVATHDKTVIGKEALSILKGYGFSPGELRGLGVQMTKLEPLKPMPASGSGTFDSSQRRLQFKKPPTPSTSQGGRPVSSVFTPQKYPQKRPMLKDIADPIDAISLSAEAPSPDSSNKDQLDSESKHKPLNIGGTQFIIPSQIDPSVLAELPADIRAKLAPTHKSAEDSAKQAFDPVGYNNTHSRSASPSIDHGLPNQSQLDPETLMALPEDVRNELLAHYDSRTGKPKSAGKGQQVLPQSPRKNRPILPSKKLALTPTKRHKISTAFSKQKSKPTSNSISTLTQSNFVAPQQSKNKSGQDQTSTALIEDISESFLAELPEDIRAEILAEQKRTRMKANSGLSIGVRRRKLNAADARYTGGIPVGQRLLRLPPIPEKPTFTSRKLSTLTDLREAMVAWVEEFSGEGEEDGPFEEDVDALISYLEKVVRIELDLQKAVSLVQWVTYLVRDKYQTGEDPSESWQKVLKSLEHGVQTAVKERGLPPVDFDAV